VKRCKSGRTAHLQNAPWNGWAGLLPANSDKGYPQNNRRQ
jgi:hypothetical protein